MLFYVLLIVFPNPVSVLLYNLKKELIRFIILKTKTCKTLILNKKTYFLSCNLLYMYFYLFAGMVMFLIAHTKYILAYYNNYLTLHTKEF